MYVAISLLLFLLCFTLNFLEIQRISTKNRIFYLQVLIVLPIFVIASLAKLIVFLIFKLYRELVYLILKFKLGTKFLGFFECQDVSNINCVEWTCNVHVLLVIESIGNDTAKDIFDTVCNSINEIIIKSGRKLPKFCSTHHQYMGYFYMQEKQNIDPLECVKKIKMINTSSEITRTELMQLLDDSVGEPLPYNNKLMWDVSVGMQPVKWKANSSNPFYPILFRFHHSVADGVNICEFISGVLGYNAESSNLKLSKKKSSLVLNAIGEFVKNCLNWCNIFFFTPTLMFVTLLNKSAFPSCEEYTPKFKNRLVAFQIEESPKYLQKIKNIRRKWGTSFASILTTALSASLYDYYVEHKKLVPEYEVFAIPFHPKAVSLQTLLPGSKKVEEIDFHNKYDASYLVWPILRTESLIERLNVISNNINQERNSKLHQVFDSYMNLYQNLVPLSINRLLISSMHIEASISSVPITTKIKLFNDNLSVCDYLFFSPDLALRAFSMYTTSYDNRLQIVLTVPKHKCTMDNVQWILNKFLEYIDKLEVESNNN